MMRQSIQDDGHWSLQTTNQVFYVSIKKKEFDGGTSKKMRCGCGCSWRGPANCGGQPVQKHLDTCLKF